MRRRPPAVIASTRATLPAAPSRERFPGAVARRARSRRRTWWPRAESGPARWPRSVSTSDKATAPRCPRSNSRKLRISATTSVPASGSVRRAPALRRSNPPCIAQTVAGWKGLNESWFPLHFTKCRRGPHSRGFGRLSCPPRSLNRVDADATTRSILGSGTVRVARRRCTGPIHELRRWSVSPRLHPPQSSAPRMSPHSVLAGLASLVGLMGRCGVLCFRRVSPHSSRVR